MSHAAFASLLSLLLAAPLPAQEPPGGEDPSVVDLDKLKASKVLDRVLVHGTITVHPEFERHVKPGGSIHLRFMDLSLRRPLTFKILTDVRFPLRYEIRRRDIVSPVGLAEMERSEFYAEAFYSPPGQGLYADRPNAVGGEAWGRAGKPWPLKVGERADIVLAFFWTPQLYAGRLKTRKDALTEGWLDVHEPLRARITPKNRLTILIFQLPEGHDSDRRRVLAAKAYENVPAGRLPVSFHFFPADFRVQPIDRDWRGFFVARLDCFDESGKRVAALQGGRASEKVGITVFPRHFRIVINQDLIRAPKRTAADAHGLLELDSLGLGDLKPAPLTDD